eukprot:PLAT2152.1.p1 GENE.PLAT2152.1~~PLAT2152.1.p1  ORF type:complete len:460 (-),score=224.49 PLAT2152.1:85-1299(-)
MAAALLAGSGIATFLTFPGQHAALRDRLVSTGSFTFWWLALGVMSSIGFGSGLHTFLLYLGPHIVRVTIHATLCRHVNFSAAVRTYFPVMTYEEDAFDCGLTPPEEALPLWDVASRVQLAAFLWGVGTAAGELPPYFFARAARLAGEHLEELEDGDDADAGSLLSRFKGMLHYYINRWGFWAIFLCAAIPNPLFDLAGLMCGHCLIPFWTFFSAVVLGKAAVKAHMQMMFFVLLFFRPEQVIAVVEVVENAIEAVIGDVLNVTEDMARHSGQFVAKSCKQRESVHACQACCSELLKEDNGQLGSCRLACDLDSGVGGASFASWASFAFNTFVMAMVVYFIISIIDSTVAARVAKLEEESADAADRSSSAASSAAARSSDDQPFLTWGESESAYARRVHRRKALF